MLLGEIKRRLGGPIRIELIIDRGGHDEIGAVPTGGEPGQEERRHRGDGLAFRAVLIAPRGGGHVAGGEVEPGVLDIAGDPLVGDGRIAIDEEHAVGNIDGDGRGVDVRYY